jgi:hypothetical protein
VRFILTINDTNHTVNPVWGDGLSISIERAQDYRALRQSLEGSLSFVREDYDLIAAQDFEQQFWLTIQVDDGAGYYQRMRGYFYKTYLTQYADAAGLRYELDKIVPDDLYERVMNALNNTYNLPDIGVATTTLQYALQPVLQIYTPGRPYVTNVNGGNSWEVPCTVTSSEATLVNDYFFTLGEIVHYVPGRGELTPDIGGRYFYDGGLNEYSNGNYDIRFVGGQWNVYDILNSDALVYTGTPGQADETLTTFTSTGGSGDTAELYSEKQYTRFLCNSATVGGSGTVDVPATDIVNQSNYTKILQIAYNGIFGSDENSATGTPFGRFADDATYFSGQYFDFPAEVVTQYYFPVGRSQWQYYSVWCYFNSTLRGYQEEASTTRFVKDAYRFSDVLSAVLGQIDSNLSHDATAAYSDFLYGVSNAIRSDQSTSFLVPKTNITVGDYDIPAKKAEVTLRDLLDFAASAWRAFWHIDSAGRFVIEHVSYYENGKSYGAANVLFNLDTLLEPKNNLPWQHGQRIYSYDLDNMPERIENAYQEQASPVFDGLPIEIESVYVNPGTSEVYNGSRLFADIDFALSTEVNKDGFFYCEAKENAEGVQEVTFDTITYQGKTWLLQNGRAAWPYMNDLYGKYNLPAPSVTLNGEAVTALSTRKSKRTSLSFAGADVEGSDYMHLVVLDGQNCEIAKASVQLATGNINLEEIEMPI